jgi:hypothetical protein
MTKSPATESQKHKGITPDQKKAIETYEKLCSEKDKGELSFEASQRGREFLYKYNKECLFKHFRKIKAKQAEVSFDGSGDSGQIESLTIDGKHLVKNAKKNGIVEGFISHTCTTFLEDGGLQHGWNVKVPFYEAIEDYCYNILESEHGGWEINAGSFGEFVLDTQKGRLITTLSMNERYEETTTSEETY